MNDFFSAFNYSHAIGVVFTSFCTLTMAAMAFGIWHTEGPKP